MFQTSSQRLAQFLDCNKYFLMFQMDMKEADIKACQKANAFP